MKKWLLGILLLTAACFRQSEETDFIASVPNLDPAPWIRSQSEALETLAATLERLDGNDDATRSAAPRRVCSVATVKGADLITATRSGAVSEADELFYLVSFGERSGSAILGADRRLPSVLAVLDETVLTLADLARSASEEPETPQDFVLSNLIGSAISTMAIDPPKPDIPNPGFDPNPWTPMKPRPHTEILVSCDKRQTPLLKTKWGQGHPYNKYCLDCPAGCGPIAVAQFLTFWQLPDPNVVGNQTFDWNLICENYYGKWASSRAKDEVARYVQTLGICLKAGYSLSGTSTVITDVEGFLKALAFPNATLLNYDAATAERMVFAGQPIIIRGQKDGEDQGHDWILDGWYRYEAKICTWVNNVMVSAEPIQDVLAHCNFGWDGRCDGYYYPWLFDTTQCQGQDKTVGDRNDGMQYRFDSDLKIIVY